MAKVNITSSTPASKSTRLASGTTNTSMTKSLSGQKTTTTINKASSSSTGSNGVKITSSTNKKNDAVRMPDSNSSSSNKMQTVVKTNQQRISPMGVQQRDQQIKKAQDALMAKRISNGTYDSSGTN